MDWPINQLSDLPPLIWQSLDHAARHFESPMRTATFCTSHDLHSGLRTVILRSADASRRLLTCHTDARSAKVRELRRNPHAQWLFYHPQERIQILAHGHAVTHVEDAIARKAWQATPLANRTNYCTALAPGIEVSTPEAVWPKWTEDSPTVDETEIGWPNFAVIACTIESLEWLQLQAEGNRRAAFTWAGMDFKGHWLVP